ncbi:hypothetical protein [Ancylobacter terrae]|uniref:hypothetical protein n=1 Tax=Ancylobacter sp. sgz301288 TaxID=3342077 RepID=UPI00385D8483
MAASKPGAKGLDLEEALRAYFWNAGYFVARGVPYRLDDEDVTDVDLWMYERPAATSRRRLILDAKNKRTPKAAERIIWAKGLQSALGVDGCIVATTDKRPGAKRLAKALGVILLDGEAVAKIASYEKRTEARRMRLEDKDTAVRAVDTTRRTNEWRATLVRARGALISGFGFQSANHNLSAASFFAVQAAQAQPASVPAQVAIRALYETSAFAAVSLDYVLADQAFRSADERRRAITDGVRFGQAEAGVALSTVRAAIGLARQFADNGPAVARQIEHGFTEAAERIPAEVIGDYVARFAGTDGLFSAARELEMASASAELPSFDALGTQAKSILGVFLDFNGVSRERIAKAWPGGGNSSAAPVPNPDLGTEDLFQPPADKPIGR